MSKYIKLEDAIKTFNAIGLLDETKIVTLKQLPSIDFEEMIKQEIEDCWKLSDSFNEKMVGTTREKLLQELISKLPK